MELYECSAAQLGRLLRTGQVSAQQITRAALARIEAVEPRVGACLTLMPRQALQAAAAVDARLAAGETLPALAGIPFGIKDNICTRGVRTTCASRMLQDYVPPYDATVIRRLCAQGAVPLAKLNLDEFAMGSSCETSCLQTTHNPWDVSRVPGGSSGGSAAAVAACEVPLALGSDTGGSVRGPAAFCGVVGLKPTYGAVSRYGLVAFASSMDQIGPLARTVEDASLLFFAMAGADPLHDARCQPHDFAAPKAIEGLRIGLPQEYFDAGIAPPVREAVLRAAQVLCRQGARLCEVSLPHAPQALAAYTAIAAAEASSNHGRFDGLRYGTRGSRADSAAALYISSRSEGFGPEVRRRILLGTWLLGGECRQQYYPRAQQLRAQVCADFAAAFAACDVLLAPSCASVAFGFGERSADPRAMYAADSCTCGASLAGLPALGVPCGFGEQGLPVGMQLIGPAWSEPLLLDVAGRYEAAVGGLWQGRTPPC